jgi:hypothetical protein
MRRAFIVGLVAVPFLAVFPCSIVTIGGETVLAVHQVAGTIVGNGRFDLVGHSHDSERISSPVSGATVSLSHREDTKVIRDQSNGNQIKLMDWKCSQPFATTISDKEGRFEIPAAAGKYCVQITGPAPKSEAEVQMRAGFIFDVSSNAADRLILADITPRWADCSGGSSIKLADRQ